MKVKILSLFSLLALLLVSTSILADGRPTGIRISRLVSGGGANVEMDVTVTGTNDFYTFEASTVHWIGYTLWGGNCCRAWQVTSSYNEPLPFAIDWGDSSFAGEAPLFGPPTGPWTGTFAHTYTAPGTYVVTVGDSYGSGGINAKGVVPYTGNPITASTRFVWENDTGTPDSNSWFSPWTETSPGLLIAITANATVSTGAGIPALNIWGLLAMSLVLVGAGILVYRRPQRTAV